MIENGLQDLFEQGPTISPEGYKKVKADLIATAQKISASEAIAEDEIVPDMIVPKEIAQCMINDLNKRIQMATKRVLDTCGKYSVKEFRAFVYADHSIGTDASHCRTANIKAFAEAYFYTTQVEHQAKYLIILFTGYDQWQPKMEDLDKELWQLGGKINFNRPYFDVEIPSQTGLGREECRLRGTELSYNRIRGAMSKLRLELTKSKSQ